MIKKMTRNFDSPIEELKYYLTLQIEAHHKKDSKTYEELEKKIIAVEKKI